MQKAKIIVAVRKRPLFQKQRSKGFTDVVTINNGNRVMISEMKQKVDLTKYIQESVFNFDHAFGEECSNEQVYGELMAPLIQSAFEGAKVSCFAYGQTGSGKTYTMNGVMSKNLPGLYTLGAYDIFEKLSQPQYSHLSAYLSFYEIYCTKLYDLLNKRTELILRQDAKSNINVVGLSQNPISCVQQFQNHLKIGSAQRVTSQNSANSQSSRSHAILQITLKSGKKGFGKVYFIDLAGNERGADHMNMKKQTQIDGQQINKSLLQLKQCIRGLDQGKNHVPFRGSKLTMCLKDSFIGFCRTVMIGNISPSSGSSQNTLNTLRYADRVKQLKNNQQISKEQLKSRQMMLPRGNKNAIKIAISNSDDEDDIAEKKRKALQEYGIKPEQKREQKRAPFVKQDNLSSDRRLSMGTSLKNNQTKGASLAKNGLGNNSSRQIPLTRAVQPRKHTLIGRRQTSSPRDQIPEYQSRHVSNQSQLQSQRYRNQPMQVQRGHVSSMDMRKNQSGVVNYERHNLGQNNSNVFTHQNSYNQYGNQQQQPHYVSHPQNYANQNYPAQNYHQGNSNHSQGQPSLNYPQYQGNPNHPQVQGNQNPIYKANNFFSNNQNPQPVNTGNKYNQQSPVNNHPQTINRQMSGNPNNTQNPSNNNQMHGSNPHQILQQDKRRGNNLKQPNINPQSWNQIVECIQLTRYQNKREQLRERLNADLFDQENELINEHSNTLQTEIQKIKQEMQVIKIIEHDRSQLSSKDYAKIMYDSIDDKIGQLQMLKQKLTTFMYKLDDMEQIQRKLDQNKRQNLGQDQQLLDDYY